MEICLLLRLHNIWHSKVLKMIQYKCLLNVFLGGWGSGLLNVVTSGITHLLNTCGKETEPDCARPNPHHMKNNGIEFLNLEVMRYSTGCPNKWSFLNIFRDIQVFQVYGNVKFRFLDKVHFDIHYSK